MSVHSTHAFAEKVALITDGTGPIGRAVALQLALNGSFVIVGVTQQFENETDYLADLSDLGTVFKTCSWNPADVDAPERLFRKASEFFGRIDMLINTSALFRGSKKDDRVGNDGLPFREYEQIVARFADLLGERPKPKVVNIFTYPKPSPLDQPSKREMFEKQLVDSTAAIADQMPAKFRVNSLLVGADDLVPDGRSDRSEPAQATPAADDVARVVLFLLSGESTAINGQLIRLG